MRDRLNPGKIAFVALALIAIQAFGQAQVFPRGYCTYWAAKRFDETSPSPHCNWEGNANEWIPNAAKQPSNGYGWVISTNVHDAEPGAIVVFGGTRYGHVAFVESVSPTGITVSEMNWGKEVDGFPDHITDNFDVPTTTFLPFSTGLKRDDGASKFEGYILPHTLRSLIAETKPWNVYYNKTTGDITYTLSGTYGATHKGYALVRSEGRVFDHRVPNTIPIYTYYNLDTRIHFYCREEADLSKLGFSEQKDETVYAFEEKDSLPGFSAVPINRYVSDDGATHLYTLLKDQVGKPWKFERAEFYVVNQPIPQDPPAVALSQH
jgi:surface antigen